MNDRQDSLQALVSRASAIRVRNVINPLLWLSAVMLGAGLPAVFVLRGSLLLAAPILAVTLLVPLATVAAYAYFMIRDPTRLHSEEYLIEHQRLLLARKGEGEVEDIESVPLATNPELAPLESSESNGD